MIRKNLELADVRKRFYDALIRKNADAVMATLHTWFLFTHADARMQNAREFIHQFIDNQHLSVTGINMSDQQMVVFDDTARITALCTIEMVIQGKLVRQHELFTEIYVKQTGQWQLLTIHAAWAAECTAQVPIKPKTCL